MKKFISLIILISLIFPIAATAVYNQQTSITYLKSQALTEWSVMALAAVGELAAVNIDFLKLDPGNSITDIEKRILAITAAGKNPENFGAKDLVAELAGRFDGQQIGSPSLLNDDIFGLLALASANARTDIQNKLVNYLKQRQKSNGGFGFAPSADPDTDLTAMTIMALLAAGENKNSPAITKAFSYLDQNKTASGFSSGFSSSANVSSTAWAVSAYYAAGQAPPGSATAYLRNQQEESGSFGSFFPDTAYAVIALSGNYYPIKTSPVVSPPPPSNPTFSATIMTPDQTLFSGQLSFSSADSVTAITIVSEAAKHAGFTYVIKNTSLGLYVESIAGIHPEGTKGWMYAVNGVKPGIGAANYILKNGDRVIWFYANFFDPVPNIEDSGSRVSGSITLSANILPKPPAPAPPPPPEPKIIFGIDRSSVDFGSLRAGESSVTKPVKLINSGTVDLKVTATVSNSSLYQEGLEINSAGWSGFQNPLNKGEEKFALLKLNVPLNYSETGMKTGQLTFWAEPK